MPYISVRTSSPSICAAYSDISPIKYPSRLKQPHCRGAGRRRQQKFESVSIICVISFLWCCSLLSARVTIAVPRTHTIRHRHTNDKQVAEDLNYTTEIHTRRMSMPLWKFEAPHYSIPSSVPQGYVYRILLYSTLGHVGGATRCLGYTRYSFATTHDG